LRETNSQLLFTLSILSAVTLSRLPLPQSTVSRTLSRAETRSLPAPALMRSRPALPLILCCPRRRG